MKKMVSFFIAVVMLLSLTIPCAATSFEKTPKEDVVSSVEALLSNFDYSRSLENAVNGYIDERVSNDILDRINVSGADSYSVECIGTISTKSSTGEPEGTVYSITAIQKPVNDYKVEDNIEASITMVWIDNFGTNNKLHRIYGSWNPNGRTLSNRVVTYGWNNITDSYYDTMRPTNNHYDFFPIGIEGFQLSAIASVNSNGYDRNPIMVEVYSSLSQTG